MRVIALSVLLALSGCFTVVGAGVGAGAGYLAGNPVKGAIIGATFGLRADIELLRDLRGAGRALLFWM